MKKFLVLGASGATGKLLVADLLNRGLDVVAVVRAESSQQSTFSNYPNYHEVSANITEMTDNELAPLLQDCEVVFSCLGHNLSFKGIFGKPRRLVTDSITKVVRAIDVLKSDKKVKIVLMNTTANANRDIPEIPPVSQRIVISILRLLLPPHTDNEQAADFLRTKIGESHSHIEWVAVANFMANLSADAKLWATWRGKMPVIYNEISNDGNKES